MRCSRRISINDKPRNSRRVTRSKAFFIDDLTDQCRINRCYGRPAEENSNELNVLRMICENFHVSQPSHVDEHTFAGDRIMVAKFLTPRRWDLVVFRYPEDPSTLYEKRLVGLPGETIHIEDGAVWASGEKLIPPDSIAGIEYLAQIPGSDFESWGSVDRPAQLGDEEYFVLGDNSAQSKDSRLWQQGAPGHNPFAVPESYLTGVVTHIYWPPQRWRILRRELRCRTCFLRLR